MPVHEAGSCRANEQPAVAPFLECCLLRGLCCSPVAALLAHPTPAAIAVAVALALAALAAVALLLAWRRRRHLARHVAAKVSRGAPRYPVVLAHGLLGFDEIRVGRTRHDYFRGVPARLEDEGAVVHRPRVAKAAAIAARAGELAAFIEELPARRVNVVAHSMGGLDARYAVARLGLERKIASLTTIGTPHLGTPLADFGANLAERPLLVHALERIGLDVEAIQDLTIARMESFNRAVPDAPGVAYASVVGIAPSRGEVNPLLLPTYLWLGERAGPSDGVVPADSQRWGEVLRTIAADHWAQIGWSRHFDAAGFYADLLRELRARGF
jgi:triacylglycerol lipase